ncbi:hypothetical protein BH10ACT11_BH10ACT11_04670 [soil metagenome]
MTSKADFSEDEWTTIKEGPTSAGMAVIGASKGGTIRETFSMARAYAEARATHGESELLDALVGEKPKMDKTKAHSYEELLFRNVQKVRDAIALVQARASESELDQYRDFIRGLCTRVAEAHEEDGQKVSPGEQTAMEQIETALRDQPL